MVEMLVIDVPLMYFQSNETLHAPVTTEGIHGKNRKRHYQSARNLKLLVWSRDVLPLCMPNSHNAFWLSKQKLSFKNVFFQFQFNYFSFFFLVKYAKLEILKLSQYLNRCKKNFFYFNFSLSTFNFNFFICSFSLKIKKNLCQKRLSYDLFCSSYFLLWLF